MARSLIVQWANVDEKNNCNETALHLATEYGHVEVVKNLIGAGANINEKNSRGETPLCLANKCHDIEVADYLSEQKDGVNEIKQPKLLRNLEGKCKDMGNYSRTKKAGGRKSDNGSTPPINETYVNSKPFQCGKDVNNNSNSGDTSLHNSIHLGIASITISTKSSRSEAIMLGYYCWCCFCIGSRLYTWICR
ncbi:MAG: ankyrin repeat domain-containing protein [Wolbachia sp.]|nr:ankyrin repeat domain-containing protein [Wolbachia sp.]MDD9336470.1 ankyrin repeat domain-containing protein [Wolbachia sp.]